MNLILQAIKSLFRKNNAQIDSVNQKADKINRRVDNVYAALDVWEQNFENALSYMGSYMISNSVEISEIPVGETVSATLDDDGFPFGNVPNNVMFNVRLGSGRSLLFMSKNTHGGVVFEQISEVMWLDYISGPRFYIAKLNTKTGALVIYRIA